MSPIRSLSLLLAWALSLGVLAPVFWASKDDFPFSTYPMFTADRSRVDLAVMLHADTAEQLLEGERVPPAWISGQEVMMAMTTIMRATWGGAHGMARLCTEVREQAQQRGKAPAAIAIVIESMDVLATVKGKEAPHARRIHFLCPKAKVLR